MSDNKSIDNESIKALVGLNKLTEVNIHNTNVITTKNESQLTSNDIKDIAYFYKKEPVSSVGLYKLVNKNNPKDEYQVSLLGIVDSVESDGLKIRIVGVEPEGGCIDTLDKNKKLKDYYFEAGDCKFFIGETYYTTDIFEKDNRTR